jgi:hypothetical protein
MSAITHRTLSQYANLRELAQGSFPRRCHTCGRSYETADELLHATTSIASDHSGLKQGFDDDGIAIIESFRNCTCGSTLMDFFHCRRDVTISGVNRRKTFDRLVSQLLNSGIEELRAKAEILKWLQGEGSDLKAMIDSGN